MVRRHIRMAVQAIAIARERDEPVRQPLADAVDDVYEITTLPDAAQV